MSAETMLEADFVVPRRTFDVVAELRLAPGERLSLFGESGAGKTTCLEAIAGLTRLSAGQVDLDGRVVNAARGRRSRGTSAVEPRHRGVAFVRQPTTLFPHLSVAANVTYGLGRERLAGGRSLNELLSEVGLDGLATAMPDALSGGQRQRVTFARAVARPFRALLLDEPFSALDVGSRVTLRTIAGAASAERTAVAVLATHDLPEAQVFGDRLAIVEDGRLLQVGPADTVVRQPASVRVAELCGYRSFLRSRSGSLAALHPDRFIEGVFPDRGMVIRGVVRSVQPSGARYTCELLPEFARSGAEGSLGAIVHVHVDSPPRVGERWEVTALSPPLVPNAG